MFAHLLHIRDHTTALHTTPSYEMISLGIERHFSDKPGVE